MTRDLETGFVLNRKEALGYLDEVAQEQTTLIMNGELDSEGATEMLDDLRTMKLDIIKHDYEYIKFFECPMSASNINIVPMVEKE